MLRRLVVGACVLSLFVPQPAPAAAQAEPAWAKPVSGALVRPFVAPHGPYAPGHRGVDFRATAGTPVRAAGGGQVSFAGSVAGTLHVVVADPGGLRTSYSYVDSVTVRRGESVRAGDIVATTGGTGDNHDGSALHFGLRQGETYLDPMVLFRAVDLAEVVQLAPTSEPFGYTVVEERRGLLDGLGDGFGSVLGVSDAVSDAARSVLVESADLLAAGLEPFEPVLRALGAKFVERARRIYEGLPPLSLPDLAELAIEASIEYVLQMRDCTWFAPPADGSGGSNHHVMVVGGFASSTGDGGRTLEVPVDLLGYEPGDVAYFSYADDGGAYTPADTLGSVMGSARLLADQLRARQRANPGREVDLIAHSLGGLVVLTFLRLVYDPLDSGYPPLGKVVTMSAPLVGAPAASVADFVADITGLGALLPGDGALTDLAEDSELMARLRAAPLPTNIELTTIGSLFDVVVPADLATTNGARHTIVETSEWHPWTAHQDIVREPETLRAARAALEGGALPCRGLRSMARAELVPPLITAAESALVPFAWGAPFDGDPTDLIPTPGLKKADR